VVASKQVSFWPHQLLLVEALLPVADPVLAVEEPVVGGEDDQGLVQLARWNPRDRPRVS